MRRFNKEKLRVFALITMPMVIVATALTWNNSRMLDSIAHRVNAQEAHRAEQAVSSAFRALQQQMSIVVTDNARWDDAFQHATLEPDQEWLQSTWVLQEDDPYYDTSYVVKSTGEVVAGFRGVKMATLTPDQYYGQTFAAMKAQLPADLESFASIASLARTSEGLAIVAIAPISPIELEVPDTLKARDILVLSKLINADDLEKISRAQIVDGLRIASNAAGASTLLQLKDTSGQPVAGLTWKNRDPGKEARDAYSGNALALVLGLIGVLIPFAILHYRTLNKMDVSEKLALRAARTDALSGLANRVQLLEVLDATLHGPVVEDVALAFIDLDGFKTVNDTFDHGTGDKLIRAFGAGLAELTTGCRQTARLGGDEFAFLVTGPDCRKTAESVAEMVIAFTSEPFNLGGSMASIGASIGIAHRDVETFESAEFMRRADIAMYDAKSAGGNHWRWFNRSCESRRSSDLLIANELRNHIEAGNVCLAYKPIIDAQSRKVECVEAQALWPGPLPLAHERLVQVAEEHGLIDALWDALLRTAIRDVSAMPGVGLAVNVSPLQLRNRNLAHGVLAIAKSLNFPASRLQLEFNEAHIMRNRQHAGEVISQLQAGGVKVALDGFGQGYGSAGYLRDITFDAVKLDRSLAFATAEGLGVQKIIQGTVLIALGLSATVVAEGIETEEQAVIMNMLGANKLQGHCFGLPLQAHELVPDSRKNPTLASN